MTTFLLGEELNQKKRGSRLAVRTTHCMLFTTVHSGNQSWLLKIRTVMFIAFFLYSLFKRWASGVLQMLQMLQKPTLSMHITSSTFISRTLDASHFTFTLLSQSVQYCNSERDDKIYTSKGSIRAFVWEAAGKKLSLSQWNQRGRRPPKHLLSALVRGFFKAPTAHLFGGPKI